MPDSQRIDPVLVEKVGRAMQKVLDTPVGDLDPVLPQEELEDAAEAAIRVVFDELGLKEARQPAIGGPYYRYISKWRPVEQGDGDGD